VAQKQVDAYIAPLAHIVQQVSQVAQYASQGPFALAHQLQQVIPYILEVQALRWKVLEVN
jgi:hypothetical protein